MLKWFIAIVLVIAMLSVAGCCCCSGYDRYSYATVEGQEQAGANPVTATPYDSLDAPGEAGANQG